MKALSSPWQKPGTDGSVHNTDPYLADSRSEDRDRFVCPRFLPRVASALLLVSGALLAQSGLNPAKLGAPPTDTWPTYNGDYSGRRYSTLTKINQGNINSL